MNIILLEKIKKLGDIGDEVSVKSGYARNFLIPNNKALYATAENRKYFEEKKNDIETQNEKLFKEANNRLNKLSGQEVILIRAASDTGQLYGSVSTKDIVKNLAEKDIFILKNEIDLNKAIKNLTYEKVIINLHPEVSCEITLNVARSSEEASKQKQLGKAITSNYADNDDKIESSEELIKKNDTSKDKKTDKTDELNNEVDNIKASEELAKNKSQDTETKE
tara:strand:+ start:610 stop:1275 length:666 start_codon:yes stop_codon:yes gene_type:complete